MPNTAPEELKRSSRADEIIKARETWVRGWDLVLPIDAYGSREKCPVEKIISLLKDDKLDPNHVDVLGLRPLHKAAARGFTEAVAVLLDHGAEIDALDSLGMTALAKCSDEEKHQETKELLLSRGAKNIPAPREKIFKFKPGGRHYWCFKYDDDGNSNENNPDAMEVDPPEWALKAQRERDLLTQIESSTDPEE